MSVASGAPQLGLKENLGQFSLLVLVNAFVGAMVGMERSILPAIAEQDFKLAARSAVLSFIVARRTREIGVRVALGASRRRVLGAVFRRPLTQVGLGVAAGAILIALGATAMFATEQFEQEGGRLSAGHLALLLLYAAFMFAVCLLACVVPTRRALRVEPIVAMRVD